MKQVTLYILIEDTLMPLENKDQKNYKNALGPVRNSKRTRNRIVDVQAVLIRPLISFTTKAKCSIPNAMR